MHTMGHQDTPDPPGPIDRGTLQTPSEQITAIVRGRITSGQYPPGTRMPSTTTLAQEFGVATRTVRKALAPLAAEELIETRPGWGTFVAHDKEA
jgi:DNA-binding GntR family transcriptional regulator